MFSVIRMPMSLTSPMAMAIPASDMMLLSTPRKYMTTKLSAIDSGSVGRMASELRKCIKNTITMTPTAISSSIRVSRSVSTVSLTIVVRS
jgi:hypothetical protein